MLRDTQLLVLAVRLLFSSRLTQSAHLITSIPAILVIAWLASRLLGVKHSWFRVIVSGFLGWLAAVALSLVLTNDQPQSVEFTRDVYVFAIVLTMLASVLFELVAQPSALAGSALVAVPGLPSAPRLALAADRGRDSHTGDSVVLRWNAAALQGVRDSKLGPPMVARALAIVHTAIYDAWAAYDQRAIGTRLGGALRRPAREHRLANKEAAISFAAYRAAIELFPGDKGSVFDPLMGALGYDPNNTTTDAATPSGIGNVVARALLEYRHRFRPVRDE